MFRESLAGCVAGSEDEPSEPSSLREVRLFRAAVALPCAALRRQSSTATTMTEVASCQLRTNTRKWAVGKALPHEYVDRVIALNNRQQQIRIYLPRKDEIDPPVGETAAAADMPLLGGPATDFAGFCAVRRVPDYQSEFH
jgi:hypothetical protein